VPDDAGLHPVPLCELIRGRQLPVIAELALPDPVLKAVGELDVRLFVDGKRCPVIVSDHAIAHVWSHGR
jgi:hypothetical protein